MDWKQAQREWNDDTVTTKVDYVLELDLDFKSAKNAVVAAFESQFVRRVMELANGNKSLAARLGKMDRPYLCKLVARHGLDGMATRSTGRPRKQVSAPETDSELVARLAREIK